MRKFRSTVSRLAAAALVAAGTGWSAPVAAKTVALLIGIGQFDNVGVTTPELRQRLSLQGPPLDVAEMRRVVEQQMGANPADVHVLLDHQASRANIRSELGALVARSAPGDTVLIFFSGHGTSQRDPDSATGLPQGTSAWIPADFDFGNLENVGARLVSGRLDIRPLALEPLDRGGRKVIIISDSCYSGNIARGIGTPGDGVVNKYVPLGDAEPLPSTLKAADFTPAPYPYRNVVMLSASRDTEKAADLSGPRAQQTVDGKPKGALTNALLGVFEGKVPADFNHDGKVSFDELQRAVREDLAAKTLPQSPQLLPALDQDPAGLIFTVVPGLAARPVAETVDRLGVALPGDAATLASALRGTGEFALGAAGAEMVVTRGRGPDRFTLTNGASDVIIRDAPVSAIVTRLRAAVWARQLVRRAAAPIALAADTEPTARGGTFTIGRDKLQFAVKADKPVWYLVFDIDASGRVITLWPTSAQENQLTPAGVVQTFGRTNVTEPEGLDHVVVLALPHPPQGIEAFGLLSAEVGTTEAAEFARWLGTLGRDYAAATIDVRAVRACGTEGAAPCIK